MGTRDPPAPGSPWPSGEQQADALALRLRRRARRGGDAGRSFDRVAQPVVQSVVDGFNGTVFAHGQTGGGHVQLLTGGADSYASRGIIPRAISAIFAAVGTCAADDVEHTVRISYLEIYNDAGFDLLDRAVVEGQARGRRGRGLAELPRVQGVVEEENGASVRVRGLSSHVARSEEEALTLLFEGDTNREVSATSMNDASLARTASSRSSSMSRVRRRLGGPPLEAPPRRLAGPKIDCERRARRGRRPRRGASHQPSPLPRGRHHPRAAREGERGRDHIPYRNSMLTSVLRDSARRQLPHRDGGDDAPWARAYRRVDLDVPLRAARRDDQEQRCRSTRRSTRRR